MTYKTRFFSSAAFAVALAATGCGDDSSTGDTNGGTVGDGGTGTVGGDDDGQTNTSAPSTMSDSADSGSDTNTPTTTDPTAGSSGGGMDVPNGGMCMVDDVCVSGNCYESPLGGICGECDEDADCDGGGCSIPNPLTMAPSVCNDGSIGGGCETSDVCQKGLTCALILEVDAIMLSASTCSECAADTDCDMGMLCAPTYDVANISGFKSCVMPGSLPDGSGCDFEGSGNESCTSGLCTPANAAGFVDLGICSECGIDGAGAETTCMGMDVCMPAEVSLSDGLLPGECVAP
jgi:hypothetical protein